MVVSVVVGTRPEIVKMAPVYFALRSARLAPMLVHSGQHYDYEMSQVFFDELGLPEPDRFLEVGSGTPGGQTGDAIIKFEREFQSSRPDIVLVEGDTNTVLAGATAAMKLRTRLGHVEAGLRTGDKFDLVGEKKKIAGVETPPEIIGEIQVIVPRPGSSVARITESRKEIVVGTQVVRGAR